MPEGLVIVTVAESTPGSLAERLAASRWLVSVPEAEAEVVAAAVLELLAADSAMAERTTKSGLRRFDVRPAVLRLEAVPGGFEAVIAAGEPLVRPDDVLQALQSLNSGLKTDSPALFSRIEQGPWDGREIGDPLRG